MPEKAICSAVQPIFPMDGLILFCNLGGQGKVLG